MAELEALIEQLERAAAQLRAGGLPADRAAALVDECARLATQAASQLDREVRAAEAPDAGPGQLRLS
jgi:hypothetical protein